MSNFLIVDPVKAEDGLDYIFAYMSAAYGNQFVRSFEGVNIDMVRMVWQKELGNYLQSKVVLDYALSNLPHDWPPSVFKFREICKRSPDVYDLDTRGGVEKLAHQVGITHWNQTEQFQVYRERVLSKAREMESQNLLHGQLRIK